MLALETVVGHSTVTIGSVGDKQSMASSHLVRTAQVKPMLAFTSMFPFTLHGSDRQYWNSVMASYPSHQIRTWHMMPIWGTGENNKVVTAMVNCLLFKIKLLDKHKWRCASHHEYIVPVCLNVSGK